jgi:hypothetical protein
MGQMAYPNANRKGQPDAIFLSEGNQMDFFWLLCTLPYPHYKNDLKLEDFKFGIVKNSSI